MLSNILDIEVPMITALNGPVLLHSEYALLTDIILATPETVFRPKLQSGRTTKPSSGSICPNSMSPWIPEKYRRFSPRRSAPPDHSEQPL